MTRPWSQTVFGGKGSKGYKAIKRQFMKMNFLKNENWKYKKKTQR